MNKIKVSVIIPVWNQEKLINRALYSIPQRSDIEIIIIDDASTDNTSKAITEFIIERKNKFGNIQLITNQENLGVGLTINKGYDQAQGEYVVALGSDDYFYSDTFKKVMDTQLIGQDIVYFNLESNDKQIWDLNPETKNGLCGAVKFIRREFLGNTRCPDARVGEDWSFNRQLLEKNPTELFTHEVVKHYNYPRIGSLSNPNKYIYGVSVIIPAYNTIKDLKLLINKLIYQKDKFYPETEIIVINDGSTEDYSEIKNMRGLIYKEQKNLGVAAARNEGLKLATRTYIAFVDSDDDICDNYLHNIYSHLKTKKTIYRLNWYIKTKEGVIGKTILPPQNTKEEIINTARSVMFYVYNHDFIKNTFFNTKYIVNEDYHWLQEILPLEMDKYEIISQPIYIYNLSNENSLTHRYNRGEITEKIKEDK